MRFLSARSSRFVTASLFVSFFTFVQLNGTVARADDDSCALSQVGTKCVGDGGAALFTTCIAITTTTTEQDGAMSNATAGGCVLIEGTYCPPANANQPCGDAGDTCQVMNVATSSGSTGGGEQTSATSYSYGVCQPAPSDAGETEGDDDGGSSSTSTTSAAADASAATGATGSTASDGGTSGGSSSSGSTSDAGTSAASSGSNDDGGCTIGQSSNASTGGAFALVAGVGLLGCVARRRRGRRD